jgi:hypothetical protein
MMLLFLKERLLVLFQNRTIEAVVVACPLVLPNPNPRNELNQPPLDLGHGKILKKGQFPAKGLGFRFGN